MMIQLLRKKTNRAFPPSERLKFALIQKFNLRDGDKVNGFTLIELIVVVMIIGILSSIAVPQFLSSADKAKQKEASLLMGSYLKAAQSYYTEYSSVPVNAGGIKNYVSVTQCPSSGGASACKSATPSVVSDNSYQWFSPSGNYRILMERNAQRFRIMSYPHGGSYANTGYGVKACFNPATGGAKVFENTGTAQQGQRNMAWPNC